MIDALNTRNGRIVNLIYDFFLNSDVLVWRESNAGRIGKWIGPFKRLGIENKICKIYLPSSFNEFQSTIVKPYLVNNDKTENHFSPIVDFLPLAQDLLPNTALLHATKILSTPIIRPF